MTTIREVQNIVGRRFGLSVPELLSASYELNISRPRQIAMWLSRRMLLRALEDIGRNFDRDHTTVQHAIRRVDAMLLRDPIAAEIVWDLARQIDPQEAANLYENRPQVPPDPHGNSKNLEVTPDHLWCRWFAHPIRKSEQVSNHRYSKWWWQDWQDDAGLQLCSFAARGLWMSLLCIAHKGHPAGHVTVNGKAPSPSEIAQLSGRGTEREVVKLLDELEKRSVFSRTSSGVIFSRRMVRDALASEEGAKYVGRRWDKGADREQPITPPNRVQPQTPTTLYSESESESETEAETDTPQTPRKREVACQDEFEDFWDRYPRKVGKGQARKAFAAALKKTTVDVLLKAVSGQRWSAEERYQPHAATWLNGERWLDAVDNFDPVLRAAGLTPEDFEDEPEARYPLARMLQ